MYTLQSTKQTVLWSNMIMATSYKVDRPNPVEVYANMIAEYALIYYITWIHSITHSLIRDL